MRRAPVLVGALVLAVVSACSSSGSNQAGPDKTVNLKLLIKAADLEKCPSSSTTPVAGGLPNLTVPCLGNGPAVHLAGLTGKPTVVNIWGSWCIPCQKETTYLASAFDADKKHVRFLGVDVEDQADSALDFDAHVSPPVHYPSVFDADRKVAIGLGIDNTPATVFLAASGKIVKKVYTSYTSTAALQRDIASYLHVTT